jgi:hypothetical protein
MGTVLCSPEFELCETIDGVGDEEDAEHLLIDNHRDLKQEHYTDEALLRELIDKYLECSGVDFEIGRVRPVMTVPPVLKRKACVESVPTPPKFCVCASPRGLEYVEMEPTDLTYWDTAEDAEREVWMHHPKDTDTDTYPVVFASAEREETKHRFQGTDTYPVALSCPTLPDWAVPSHCLRFDWRSVSSNGSRGVLPFWMFEPNVSFWPSEAAACAAMAFLLVSEACGLSEAIKKIACPVACRYLLDENNRLKEEHFTDVLLLGTMIEDFLPDQDVHFQITKIGTSFTTEPLTNKKQRVA